MDDAVLAFEKVCTAIDAVKLQIDSGSSDEYIDAAQTQLEYAVAEFTDCIPARPLVPEPHLDLDDKAKMFVYRILELLEEDAEDMAEKLQKVVSHLYKHVSGRWPHEVIKEDDKAMWLPQDTEAGESRDDDDDNDGAPGSATSNDEDEKHDNGADSILHAGNYPFTELVMDFEDLDADAKGGE